MPSVSSLPLLPPSVAMSARAYLGEGMLLVTDKVVQKIIKLEFVEMRDVMPEIILWLLGENE